MESHITEPTWAHEHISALYDITYESFQIHAVIDWVTEIRDTHVHFVLFDKQVGLLYLYNAHLWVNILLLVFKTQNA